MDPKLQKLLDDLNSASGPITIDRSFLGIDGNSILNIFQIELGQSQLRISASPAISHTDQLVKVLASSEEDLLSLKTPQIEAIFFIKGGELSILLKIDTPSNWKPGDSFENFANTYLDHISFSSDTQLLLSSVAISDISIFAKDLNQGLGLVSQIQVGGSLQALHDFNPAIPASLDVYAEISRNDDQTYFNLKASSIPDQSLNLQNWLDLGFADAYFEISFVKTSAGDSILKKSIHARVLLSSSGGKTVSLPLSLSLPFGISGWSLSLEENKSVTLSNLADFFSILGTGGQFDLNSLLPTSLHNVLSAVELNSFSLGLSSDLSTFEKLNFSLSADTNWDLIPNILSFQSIQLGFRVYKENTGYRTGAWVSGDFEVMTDLHLKSSLRFPLSEGDWSIEANGVLRLPDLGVLVKFIGGQSLSSLLPAQLGDIGGFDLIKAHLTYNPERNELTEVEWTLRTYNSWVVIDNQLELHTMTLTFTLQKGVNGWSLLGEIQGRLIVGGIDIYMHFYKDSAEGDWLSHVSTKSVALPSLQDLQDLSGGTDVVSSIVPQSISDVHLQMEEIDLVVDLSTRKIQSFEFVLVMEEIDFDIVKISDSSLHIALDYESEPLDKRCTIFGKISIAGIDMFVSSDYASEEGWHLEGKTGVNEEIPFGNFMTNLATDLILTSDSQDIPQALRELSLSNIAVSYYTQTKDFTFSIETKFPIEGKEVDAVIHIELSHNNGKYSRKFSGIIKVGDMEFDLIFKQDQDAETLFLAAYENTVGSEQSIKPLVELITDNSDIINTAEGLSFNLKDALLVIDKEPSETKILFGLDIGGGLDISKLPLVGKMFPKNAILRMTFQPVLTSKDFASTDLDLVKPLEPTGGFQLPKEALQRLGFSMQLLIGTEVIDLSFPIGVDASNNPSKTALPTTAEPSTSNDASAVPASTDKIKWISIQKQLGPIHFGRVGIQYENSELFFFLDASLSLAGLTISLDGLYVSSTINPIHPQFGLHGLGIDYKKGPLEIGGAFLRQTFNDPEGNPYDTYDGTAIIRTEEFALAALGSYSYYQSHPSLFIYAFVDVPLGGPAFFFITGLAAGFGYNRRIVMPALDRVKDFPLVQQVISGPPDTTDGLSGVINQLHEVIPPAIGEYFFAAGIRFSSFEIIDSFILLMVSFGNDLEVDVLGLSTLVIPTPEAGQTIEPLAEVQMALKAVFNPAKGYLKVQAGLTSASFILSRDCHLTGGFAFYTWFKDNPEEGASAGDFVLSLGGYHPRFRPPSYYPRVAPLGFNWNVGSGLLVKGDFYFALVPSAVMAGGHLSATWHSGNLKAWFKMGADFIISWKPYFYDASMYLDMGVSYTYHFFGTHHISVHVGADLDIWGPEFSGKAHVHLWIVTFNVSFGADSKQVPPALEWDEFRQGFLPKNDTWCNSTISKGLVKKLETDAGPLMIVNPADFRIETGSAIPITTSDNYEDMASFDKVNIGSMKITDKIDMTHHITIRRGPDITDVDETNNFTFTPLKKNVPSALWGPKFKHSEHEPKEERIIQDVCMGFSIKGKEIVPSSETHDVASEILLNEDEYFNESPAPKIGFENPRSLDRNWLKTAGVKQSIAQEIEARSSDRKALLDSLNFKGSYNPNKELLDEFIVSIA